MKSGQRILVTGAGGFLGRALVEKLWQEPHVEVVAVCHHRDKCPHVSSASSVNFSVADLASEKETALLLARWKPDVIVHLAAIARLQAGEKNPEKAVAINVLAGIYLLQAAARYGTRKFLFTSSDLAREPQSVVGITKWLMENYLRLFPDTSPEAVSFRMPNLYNFPGSVMDIFSRQIAENKDLSITDERMARRFITREEASEYLLFLEKNGQNHKIYSVKQEPIFIKDLALKMLSQSGKNLKLKIIGARPGEKLYQASYSEAEATDTGFGHLALLQLPPASLEEIFSAIGKLPVCTETKAVLQNKFKNLF